MPRGQASTWSAFSEPAVVMGRVCVPRLGGTLLNDTRRVEAAATVRADLDLVVVGVRAQVRVEVVAELLLLSAAAKCGTTAVVVPPFFHIS